MKRIKLLSTILLAGFLIAIIQNLVQITYQTVKNAANSSKFASKNNLKEDFSDVFLDFRPINGKDITINETNLKNDAPVALIINNANLFSYTKNGICPVFTKKLKILKTINTFVSFIIIIIKVYALILIIKTMSSFSQNKVFENRIIKYIKHIGIVFIILGIIKTLWTLSRLYIVQAAVELTNYTISFAHFISWNDLILGLVILVMNEIIMYASGLKQEQALTI